MSERGHHSSGRGGRGGGRGNSDHRGGGRGGSGHRGGGGGGGGGHGAQHSQGGERPKKENILDLGKYMDKRITVKFNGGRESMCRFSVWSPLCVPCGALDDDVGREFGEMLGIWRFLGLTC